MNPPKCWTLRTDTKRIALFGIHALPSEGYSTAPYLQCGADGMYAKHGLINVQRKDNSIFGYNYSLSLIEEIRQQALVSTELLPILDTLRSKLAEQNQLFTTNAFDSLVQIINQITWLFSEIACICLPKNFLMDLKNPLGFLVHTAPLLGQDIINYLGECNQYGFI